MILFSFFLRNLSTLEKNMFDLLVWTEIERRITRKFASTMQKWGKKDKKHLIRVIDESLAKSDTSS